MQLQRLDWAEAWDGGAELKSWAKASLLRALIGGRQIVSSVPGVHAGIDLGVLTRERERRIAGRLGPRERVGKPQVEQEPCQLRAVGMSAEEEK